MKVTGNTVLITGGSEGIGLALAQRFLSAGNRAIVCGRRQEKLEEAKARFPQLNTRLCDVSDEAQRRALFTWVKTEFPDLNVLVNNAGIQHRNLDLMNSDTGNWDFYRNEVATNLEAPIHFCMLFLPLLAGKPNATVVNVSSDLAFTPMVSAPIYCATKAAVHSFTMSLRHQVAGHGIAVVEISPPAVQTNLGGEPHTWGAPLDEFADGIFRGLEDGADELGYGPRQANRLSRDEIDARFQQMNRR